MNDIQAARAAGMRVICLTYGYNQGVDLRTGSPDRLLEDFRELAEHLALVSGGSDRKLSSAI